jgi:CHAT domain-containing protein/tetratricopeptide (TPR) repeat protein
MTPLLLLLLAVSAQVPSARIDWLLQHARELQSPQQRHADLAIPFLLEAVTLSESSGDKKREAQTLTQLAMAYTSTHLQEQSASAFQRALELARGVGDTETETNALAGLGSLCAERGDYPQAQKYYRAVLDIGTREDIAAVRVRAFNGLAAIADHRGHSAEGARYARIGLAELDGGVREGKSFPAQFFFSLPYNLGKALSESGEFAEASLYFERARNAAERGGMISGVWHVLQETGEMYRAQGDLSTAVRYYQRALAEANRLESHDPEAITLRALGAAAEARGDFGAALVHYQESLAIFEKAGFRSELPQTLTMLSRMQFVTGKRDAARESLDRAAALSATMAQPLGEVYQKLEAGRQKFEGGDLRAKSEFLAALDTARSHGLESFSASALLGLADIARAEGNVPLALQRYSEAADAIDATRARIPSIEERSMYVSATHGIYEHWLDTLLKAGLFERAFIVIERERSRNVLDALLSQAIERPPEVRAMNARVSSLQVQLTSSSVGPAKRRLLLDQLDDAERKLDLMQTSSKAPPRFNRDLHTLRATLQDDEAWIEYTTRPNEVIVFLLTRHGFSVTEHAAGSLASRIGFFNDLLNSVHSEEAIRPGVALSNDLLGDVLPKLPASVHRLIIGVAGELAGLPFDALPDPRDQGKPILGRYEVAYAPSLATLAELRDRHSPSPRYDLLGVAPLAGSALAAATLPIYRSAALAPLPWSRREVEEVAQLVRGRADSLFGGEATEEAFKRLRLRDYKVIHLATHALLDPQFPARSGIVFSRGSATDDGWLQMREIYQLDLAGQLVVLSACQTAFGTVSSAEGMQSLARAFTYAGARAVVGTLWKVEDITAARIVENMYSAIGRGESVSAALRSAQLDAAGAQPYRNARAWAGWVATGDPAARPDIASPLSSRRRTLAFAAIFAAVIAATAYRFR